MNKRHGDPFVVKVDKNGSKHWVDNNCPKCGGTGYIRGYEFIDGGRCWKCGASGFHPHTRIEHTKEYQAILDAKRKEKLRKKNLAERAKFLAMNGFNEQGTTFAVLGNTFNMKDELKAIGAKFNHMLGWHFANRNDKYETIELTVDDCFYESVIAQLHWNEDVAEKVKNANDNLSRQQSTSTFVGEVGTKIAIELMLDACFTIVGMYGTSYINKFKDDEGNIFVWKTGCQATNLQKKVALKGTIKEHNEYKGEKQTILTRCKVQDIA